MLVPGPADADPPVPDPPEIQVAARLLAEGHAAEAARRLEGLATAAPAYAAAHVLLAKALEGAGRPDAALAAWHRAYFLVPTSPLVRRERQRLLEAQSRPVPSAPYPEPSPEPSRAVPEVRARSEEAGGEQPGAQEHAPQARYEAAPPAPPAPALPASDVPLAATPGGDLADAHLELAGEAGTEPTPAEPAPPGDRPGSGEAALDSPPAPDAEAPAGGTVDPFEPAETPADAPTLADAAAPEASVEAPPAHDSSDGEAPRAPESPDAVDVTPDEGAAATVADELDALIRRLEDAPRIRPDPTFEGPPLNDADDADDEMVSETLARIYAAQRQFAEAAAVYEKLAAQRPEQAEDFLRKAAEVRARSGKG